MPRLASTFAALTAAFLFSSANALQNMQCQDGPYPYCVHVQSDKAPSGGAWPTMIFLPGSGARGSSSNAESLAQYDGAGKLIMWYYSGQKTTQSTLQAEQFLTIIPIAPDGSRHFDPDKVLAILNEVKGKYKVDAQKVSVTGYSMGGRGTWRFGVHHPEVLAAMAPSAGPSESEGFGTLQQEYATPTFNLLKNVVSIPIMQFAGSNDETAGTTEPQKTQDEIVRLGGKLSQLVIVQGATHADMSTKPWAESDMLSWILKQKRGGSSASKPTSTKTPAATSTKKHSPSKTSSPAVSDEDEEDCEDEEDDAEDDEEDCEEEDEDEEDEDCEDEAEDVTVSQRDNIPVAPAPQLVARQEHHFVFPRSRNAHSPLATRHRRGPGAHRMVVRRRS